MILWIRKFTLVSHVMLCSLFNLFLELFADVLLFELSSFSEANMTKPKYHILRTCLYYLIQKKEGKEELN